MLSQTKIMLLEGPLAEESSSTCQEWGTYTFDLLGLCGHIKKLLPIMEMQCSPNWTPPLTQQLASDHQHRTLHDKEWHIYVRTSHTILMSQKYKIKKCLEPHHPILASFCYWILSAKDSFWALSLSFYILSIWSITSYLETNMMMNI